MTISSYNILNLYYTSFSVCLSATAKYCSRVLEVYEQKHMMHEADKIADTGILQSLEQTALVIALSLCYIVLSCRSLALIFFGISAQIA